MGERTKACPAGGPRDVNHAGRGGISGPSGRFRPIHRSDLVFNVDSKRGLSELWTRMHLQGSECDRRLSFLETIFYGQTRANSIANFGEWVKRLRDSTGGPTGYWMSFLFFTMGATFCSTLHLTTRDSLSVRAKARHYRLVTRFTNVAEWAAGGAHRRGP